MRYEQTLLEDVREIILATPWRQSDYALAARHLLKTLGELPEERLVNVAAKLIAASRENNQVHNSIGHLTEIPGHLVALAEELLKDPK